MFKEKKDNVEVYFICYKKEEMELVETYYDPILDVHCWYFNAYLAYKHWKNRFRNLEIGELTKLFLTLGASKYIMYKIEKKEYKNKWGKERLMRELEKISPEIERIVEGDILVKN